MLILLIVLSFSLSACSFNDIENAVINLIKGTPNNNRDTPPIVVENDEIIYIGDVAEIGSENGNKLHYVVESMKITDNISDFNLNYSDFSDYPTEKYLNPDGTFKNGDYVLVYFEINIKKILNRNEYEPTKYIENIGGLNILNLEEEDYLLSSGIAYFDINETEDITRSAVPGEYYHYSLKEGQSVDVRIGIFADKRLMEGNEHIPILRIGLDTKIQRDTLIRTPIEIVLRER